MEDLIAAFWFSLELEPYVVVGRSKASSWPAEWNSAASQPVVAASYGQLSRPSDSDDTHNLINSTSRCEAISHFADQEK